MTPADLHAHLVAAAREFNSGRYFEAHEALEEALDDVPEDRWSLFLGLIQIAVGYHKITQSLWSGAARMLEIGLEKVAPFSDELAGLELEALRSRATRDLQALRVGRFHGDDFVRLPPRLTPLARSRGR